MIQLSPHINPSQSVLDDLQAFQDEVDTHADFVGQINHARQLFAAKNKKTNSIFKEVRKALSEMCNSTRRCVYCEDSVANQIEHIWPKSFYPEKCFDWGNYVYACGPCNGPKNNLFAIFRDGDGALQHITVDSNIGPVKPPSGQPVLINPRIENPLDFCILDLSGSFKFIVKPGISPQAKIRAEYTFFTVLKMDNGEREPLRQARLFAYENYKDALFSYIKRKEEGATLVRLQRIITRIKRENHPTVWKEMQRQFHMGILGKIDPELNGYFLVEPEALTW